MALKKVIGVGVGTSVYDDFSSSEAMFFFGQNTGSNSPRLLHALEDAVERGCKIVTFNPIREKGLETFINPQNPVQMLTGKEVRISCQYHQVKAGGDIAAILGLCKHVLAKDDEARRAGRSVVDRDFIEQHTHGFDAVEQMVRDTGWEAIEAASGLSRDALEAAGQVYVDSERTVGFYGMGLTQHVGGFDNVAMLVNLLLLKGNIGRDGTGVCPVRGHSNVQGQRTVGISEKPELVPLDKLAKMYGFEPPRWKGMGTVETCEGVLAGRVRAFVSLGGNFVRAVPEREAMEQAWTRLTLTVSVATKLNRSHLLPGEESFLLPCLGRSEEDRQAGGPQVVTIEDSLSCIHGSIGGRAPASEHLLSELAIVAGIAKATLPPNPRVDWDRWVGDYGVVRERIEETYPEFFKNFNDRLFGALHVPSLEAMLGLDIDGVVIATPSALHAAQSIRALEAGKAVFCQKPLGRTAAETRSVVRAAHAADRLLGVDLSYRHIDGMRQIVELVRSGMLGHVFAVDLTFHNAYGPDKAWFYDPARSGGGCVVDLGVHLVDLALWTLDFPEVTDLDARLSRGGEPLLRGDVEDFAIARFAAGDAQVRLTCSWRLNAGRDAIIEAAFYGSKGGAALRNVGGSFYDFTAERFDGTAAIRLAQPPDAWGGRAAACWAERLARSRQFEHTAEQLVRTADVLDRIYGR